ncbi:MAG: NAD(P)-binding domain-containing protein [Myxococcota bacterium]
MKIAILGAGNVGTTLGRRFVDAGHEVVYAVRNPLAPKSASLAGERTEVLAVPEAVAAAEVVLLSTPWPATEAALAAAGDFGGKPLLDATNPIGPGLTLTHGHDDSGAEQVQRWARGARVVKVFNSTGRENMADPAYPEGPAAMFLCGDDDDACETARTLCEALGFEPVRVGGLARARVLEPAAMLWIQLAAVLGHGRDIAFGLLRREDR